VTFIASVPFLEPWSVQCFIYV